MNARVVEVVVRGRLAPELVFALEGFGIQTDSEGLTRIVGPVTDQARLLGLLEMFDDLNIEVVSVNPIPERLPSAQSEVGPSTGP